MRNLMKNRYALLAVAVFAMETSAATAQCVVVSSPVVYPCCCTCTTVTSPIVATVASYTPTVTNTAWRAATSTVTLSPSTADTVVTYMPVVTYSLDGCCVPVTTCTPVTAEVVYSPTYVTYSPLTCSSGSMYQPTYTVGFGTSWYQGMAYSRRPFRSFFRFRF